MIKKRKYLIKKMKTCNKINNNFIKNLHFFLNKIKKMKMKSL